MKLNNKSNLWSQRHICFLLAMGIAQELNSQAISLSPFIDPFAMNVTGRHIQISNLYFDWSFGETPMVQTLNTKSNYIISTGFLQSSYYPLSLYNQLDSFAIQIKVGPNPFSSRIVIQSKVADVLITEIQLMDFYGILIYHSTAVFSGSQFYHEIMVQKLRHPICFLSIRYSIADKIYKTKYVKLIQH